MDEAGRRAARAWDEAQASDLHTLPNVRRVVVPGRFGTYPEDSPRIAPLAPTLTGGPEGVGEWREEQTGDELELGPGRPGRVALATLLRQWPVVGFAVMVRNIPAGVTVTFAPYVVARWGRAAIPASALVVVGPSTEPTGWLAVSQIYAGVRVEIGARVTGGAPGAPFKVAADLWGYNVPGFGP